MGSFKIEGMGGMLPAWNDRVIPPNQAAQATNTYLYSGATIGWRTPKLLRTLLNSAAKFAYRVPTLISAIASVNLAFVLNPGNGDTVLVGEQTYTFTTDVEKAYDVLLSGTSTVTSNNLFLALTSGATSGVTSGTCGPGTVPNPNISPQNPYVGYPFSNVGGSNAPGANTLFLVPVTPTGTMDLNSLSFMPAATAPGANFTGVIYNNVNQINAGSNAYENLPSTLIANTVEVTGTVTGTAKTAGFGVPVTLEEGSIYWIGFIVDSSVALAIADAGTNGFTGASVYGAGPPNVAPTTQVSLGQPDWQIWGNVTRISSQDSINTITTHDFGAGAIPVIELQAPELGAAYNTTLVSESTGNVRLSWIYDLVSLAHTTSAFMGGANQTANTADITQSSTWLEFIDPDTTVVRTPVVNDSFMRYYFASPSAPPSYNTYDRIVAGQSPWLLGVPAPGCAPGVTVTGGGSAATVGFATSTSVNNFNISDSTMLLLTFETVGTVTLNQVSCVFQGMQDDIVTDTVATAVIYSDNNGSPGSLLATGQQVFSDPIPVGGNLTSVFSSPVGLLAQTKYWFGLTFSGTPKIQLADDTGTTGYISNLIVEQIPPFNPTVTPGQPDWQIWGDCTDVGVLETRAYVYTWVTAYGEEGPPSPATLEDGYNNGVWTIELFTPSIAEMGSTRNITRTNLYRTVTATGGSTTYFLVDSFDVSQGRYTDTVTDPIVVGNIQLPSTLWYPPPEGLQGMKAMPNGMIVGFKANELWFCEPYRPHAWPPSYVLTTDFPIVGVGVTGQSVVACTTSKPMVASGVQPAVMSETKVNLPAPCSSRGSIVDTGGGVFYATLNGLVRVTDAGIGQNVTETWITRDRWNKLTPQKNVRACQLLGAYFAFGTTNGADVSVAQQGYNIELADDTQAFSVWPQPGGHRLGFSQMTAPNGYNVDNLLVDPWSGVTTLIQNGGVYYYDFTDPAPVSQRYLWRSKKFQQAHVNNYAVMRVWFDTPANTPAPPGARDATPPSFTDTPAMSAVGKLGVVRVIADDIYVTERELRSSNELLRIQSGFKASTWQWEIEAIVEVSNIKVATTVNELKKVE